MARKPWVSSQSPGWWWRHPAYRLYMLREATSVPLLLYALCLLSGVYRLVQGEQAFATWLDWFFSPPLVLLQVVALAAALLHAITWFRLVPKILVIPTPRGLLPGHWLYRAHLGLALLCWLGLPLLAWWGLPQLLEGGP